ncbi:MAG: ParB/RepB/Spo0J family partition protein [Rickettsiaceae bacterium]|nr:ParB/RepB/Spo0J family partition protein [Rickettsiaceae bacterium]
MPRKIKYKPVSKELSEIAKPSEGSSARTSLGIEQTVGEFFFIPIEKLIPFRNQARKDFKDEELTELAKSIKEYGIRQPLTIMKVEGNKYEVISGERRLRAAKIAGLVKIPCIIIKDTAQADAIALVENIHRKDLHPVELGECYAKLIKNKIFTTQKELSSKISVSESKISEYINYSLIPLEVKEIVLKNNITSRDKLRDLVLACNKEDDAKTNQILGIAKKQKENFSIIRVMFNDGQMKVQDRGIKKLSKYDKQVLKSKLKRILESIS